MAARAKARGGALRRPAGVVAPGPKAKAGAKAKAKPDPARGRLRPRRRGAALEKEEAVVEDWKKGRELPLSKMRLEDFKVGDLVVVSEADYMGSKVKVAGSIVRMEILGEQQLLHLKLHGTGSEEILRVHGANPDLTFAVHKCPSGCGLLETGDRFLHGIKGRLVVDKAVEEEWVTNLETVKKVEMGEDELEALRKKSEGLTGVGAPVEDKRSESRGKKEKKAKKKRKKDRKKSEESSRGKDKKRGISPRVSAQKKLEALFAGTGLDPKARTRKKVLRKARRYVTKKGKTRSSTSSSSGSSSSTRTSEDGPMEGLFMEASKARALSERYPGVLTLESMRSMREALLTEAGEELEEAPLKPVGLLYYRNYLSKKASGAMSRELLNLASALDALLKGRVALAADIITQRMKSDEQILQGVHWSVAQRMEVPVSEGSSMAGRVEVQQAQKENYQDSRTRYLATLPRKGERYEKGEKGKGKGGKGNWKGDGDKGKNQDGKDSNKKGDKK